MIENFIEYMWYLLTTPLKKLKKALNKWYILCKVFGRRFDEVKEDILRARDEGMVATCGHEMLPVHGADRRLARYEGEHPENYRSRIAMYDELCKLGGTNEGVLLAVKKLGFEDAEVKPAREVKGGDEGWAEFYILLWIEAGHGMPIAFGILKKEVRVWKEVGAKDRYQFIIENGMPTIINRVRPQGIPIIPCQVLIRNDVLGVGCLDAAHRMGTGLTVRTRNDPWYLDGRSRLNGAKTLGAERVVEFDG